LGRSVTRSQMTLAFWGRQASLDRTSVGQWVPSFHSEATKRACASRA
jgi:hypothetical protein